MKNLKIILLATVFALFVMGLILAAKGGEPKKGYTLRCYTATWCVPCQRDKVHYPKLRETYETVREIDCSNYAPRYVKQLPYYILTDDKGRVVHRSGNVKDFLPK